MYKCCDNCLYFVYLRSLEECVCSNSNSPECGVATDNDDYCGEWVEGYD